MTTYAETTNDIKVSVKPIFIEKESDLVAQKYVFAYFITIENMGMETVQLLRRQWFIEDSTGESLEVQGEGVVGKQPFIGPGKSHNYNSFCVIKTFRGSMEGYYEMEKSDGSVIQVNIPRFILTSHLLN